MTREEEMKLFKDFRDFLCSTGSITACDWAFRDDDDPEEEEDDE